MPIFVFVKLAMGFKQYSFKDDAEKRSLSRRMISEDILVRIWWLAPNLEFPISNEAGGQIFDVAIAGQYFDFMSTQPPELEKR